MHEKSGCCFRGREGRCQAVAPKLRFSPKVQSILRYTLLQIRLTVILHLCVRKLTMTLKINQISQIYIIYLH